MQSYDLKGYNYGYLGYANTLDFCTIFDHFDHFMVFLQGWNSLPLCSKSNWLFTS